MSDDDDDDDDGLGEGGGSQSEWVGWKWGWFKGRREEGVYSPTPSCPCNIQERSRLVQMSDLGLVPHIWNAD